MKRFQLIEHTADTGLIAYGHNLAEAFANAGYGLFSIITELLQTRFPYYYMLIFGGVVVVVILFFPSGLLGVLERWRKYGGRPE